MNFAWFLNICKHVMFFFPLVQSKMTCSSFNQVTHHIEFNTDENKAGINGINNDMACINILNSKI